jgi:hypothetical protein
LLLNLTQPLDEKLKDEGVLSSFEMDFEYQVKNAGPDLYAKYFMDIQNGVKVVTQENVTIDNEPAVIRI